jgi:hypothetical protein
MYAFSTWTSGVRTPDSHPHSSASHFYWEVGAVAGIVRADLAKTIHCLAKTEQIYLLCLHFQAGLTSSLSTRYVFQILYPCVLPSTGGWPPTFEDLRSRLLFFFLSFFTRRQLWSHRDRRTTPSSSEGAGRDAIGHCWRLCVFLFNIFTHSSLLLLRRGAPQCDHLYRIGFSDKIRAPREGPYHLLLLPRHGVAGADLRSGERCI